MRIELWLTTVFLSILLGCAGQPTYPKDWEPTVRAPVGECPDITGTYNITPIECHELNDVRPCDKRERLDTVLGILASDHLTIHQPPDGTITISSDSDPSLPIKHKLIEKVAYSCTSEAITLEHTPGYVSKGTENFGYAATTWGEVSLMSTRDNNLAVYNTDKQFGAAGAGIGLHGIGAIGCCFPVYTHLGFWMKFEPWAKKH